jgi:hypothetical protein
VPAIRLVKSVAYRSALDSPHNRPLNRPTPSGIEQLYRVGTEDAQVSIHKVQPHSFWLIVCLISFLAIALSNDFVMSSILALSSFHLGFLTRDQETKQLAYHHKATALRGLQTAIGSFSKDNCEAILAASILLSWQATER